MILYDWVLHPDCYAVRLMAALTGQSLTLKAIDIFPGHDHLKPDFLALNPAASLPVLEVGTGVLTTPPAMLVHLAEGRPDWRGAPAAEAEWLALSRALADSLGRARTISMMGAEGDLAACQALGTLRLRQLEEALFGMQAGGQVFLAGPRPGIADIACFPHVMLAPDGGVPLAPYPAIRAWTRAIRALPGFLEMPGIPRLHELTPEPGPAVGG